MRVVFFALPYAGHVIPNLPLIKEMLNRNIEVLFYGDNFKRYPELQGTTKEQYPEYILEYCKMQANENVDLEQAVEQYFSYLYDEELLCEREYQLYNLGHRFYEEEYEKIAKWKPDYLFYDRNAVFLDEILYSTDSRCVELNCSTWQPEKILKSKSWLSYLNDIVVPELDGKVSADKINLVLRKSMRLSKRLKANYKNQDYESLHFSYSCPSLQDEAGELLDDKQYIGFHMEMLKPEKMAGSIYVSRGTMAESYGIQLLKETLNQLSVLEQDITVSLGNNGVAKTLLQKENYPENIHLELFTDQVACLSNASVYVTHGGITGVREALLTGTPMVVIPANFPDYQVGKALEKAHAGILVTSLRQSKKDIAKSVQIILENYETYQAGILDIANDLRKCWIETGCSGLLDSLA